MSRYLGQIVLRNNVDHMMLCLQVAGKRKRKKIEASRLFILWLAFSFLFSFCSLLRLLSSYYSFLFLCVRSRRNCPSSSTRTKRGEREREKKRNQRWVYKQASTQYLPHSSHHLVLIHLLSFFHIVFVDDYNYARMK